MRFRRLVPGLLIACAPAAAAQETPVVRPGGAGMQQAPAVREGTESFELYIREHAAPVGRMTLRTVLARAGGRDAVVRTEITWIGEELAHEDSFALDRRTLAPLLLRSRQEGEEAVSLDFGPDRVRGTRGAAPGTPVDLALAEPLFLDGAMDLLLAALPLAPGYTARLAVYDTEEGVPRTVRVQVAEAQEVRLPSGRAAPAWRVRVRGGGAEGTYWLDRESRTLVQYQSADGALRLVRGAAAPAGRADTR